MWSGWVGPGEVACLSAAAMWAAAVVLFRPAIAAVGAPAVNLLKCLLAGILWTLTLAATGGLAEIGRADPADLWWLAASGVVGLTIGDTALFASVRRTGAHHALLLLTLAPLFAAALAIPTGERLGPLQGAGGLVVLAGVALVIRSRARPPAGGAGGWAAAGVALGILAAFGQGAGVTLAKWGLDEVGVLQGTLVRLAAGTLGLLVVAAARGELRLQLTAISRPATLRSAVPASLLGTYLALMLMTAGVAWAPASVASVLLATSPVLGLILESAIDRRRPPALGVVGTLVAVAGVAILTAAN